MHWMNTSCMWCETPSAVYPLECRGNYGATYEVGILAVDGMAVTFGTARRGLGGATAYPGPLFAAPYVTAHPSTASTSHRIAV